MTLRFDIYFITPEAPPAELVRTAMRLLAGAPAGRVGLLLRHRALSGKPLLSLARELRKVTSDQAVTLLVHRRADVARLASADGVHVPSRGLSPSEARIVAGAAAVIGVSCHSAADVHDAAGRGASFAVLGPFAPTPGKGPPLPPAAFRDATDASLPVLALGGIDETNAQDAVTAGANGIAMIRAAFDAPHPEGLARRLAQSLDTARARLR